MPVEVISAPDYIQEDVIDLEIMVPSGLCRFTLREEQGDAWHEDDRFVYVTWNKSDMKFYQSRIDYTTVTKRTIRTQVKKPKIAPVEPVADSAE